MTDSTCDVCAAALPDEAPYLELTICKCVRAGVLDRAAPMAVCEKCCTQFQSDVLTTILDRYDRLWERS